MVNALLHSGLFAQHLSDPECAACFEAEQMVAHFCAFERAHTEARMALGLCEAQAAEQALEHLNLFSPDLDALRQGSARDGLPVPAFVTALRAGLPEEIAIVLHNGATSQDVLDTAMMLCLRGVSDLCLERLNAVQADLCRLEAKFADRPFMARTRYQDALPCRMGDRLRIWRDPLAAHQARLTQLRGQLAVQFGGPIGVPESPPDQAKRLRADMAARLGLADPGRVWHTDRSLIIDIGSCLTLITGALGKMGQDLCLMAQQGEVLFSRAGGSSAMPHKQNPVGAEALVTLARFTAAQNGALGQALLHEQERSGQAWALEWMSLPSMAEATGAALRSAQELLENITVMGAPASR